MWSSVCVIRIYARLDLLQLCSSVPAHKILGQAGGLGTHASRSDCNAIMVLGFRASCSPATAQQYGRAAGARAGGRVPSAAGGAATGVRVRHLGVAHRSPGPRAHSRAQRGAPSTLMLSRVRVWGHIYRVHPANDIQCTTGSTSVGQLLLPRRRWRSLSLYQPAVRGAQLLCWRGTQHIRLYVTHAQTKCNHVWEHCRRTPCGRVLFLQDCPGCEPARNPMRRPSHSPGDRTDSTALPLKNTPRRGAESALHHRGPGCCTAARWLCSGC